MESDNQIQAKICLLLVELLKSAGSLAPSMKTVASPPPT